MSDSETGRPVPPYEGRKEAAEVDTAEGGGDADIRREGANIGGAERPRQSGEAKAPDPASTERGEHAAPADEQPAETMPEDRPDDGGTGPAHQPGVARGQDHA